LKPDGDRVELIGTYIARDASGRFYTNSQRGSVHVWDDNGNYLRTIGRAGDGPGEFRSGVLGIHASKTGRLHVIDGRGRWTVFDSGGKLIGSTGAKASVSMSRTAILSDESLLDAERGSDDRFFSVLSAPRNSPTGSTLTRDETKDRAFGLVSATELRYPKARRTRLISVESDTSFWAGPPQATGRGYELELWSTNGRLLHRFVRSAPWFAKGSDINQMTAEAPLPTEVEVLWSTGDGLLVIGTRVTNTKGFAAWRRSPADSALRNRAFDIYVDIVDTRAGEILAAMGPMALGTALEMLPGGWFHGSDMGYGWRVDDDGFRVARIVKLELAAK
jgi:hypothetical protein